MIGMGPTYTTINVEPWQEAGDGFMASHGPDPLWACGTCGAAVSDQEKHTEWHSLSRIGFG